MRSLFLGLVGALAGAVIAAGIGWSIGQRMGSTRSERATASGMIAALMGLSGALGGAAAGASSERRLLPGTSVLSVTPDARRRVVTGSLGMGFLVGAFIGAEAVGRQQSGWLFGGLGFVTGCVMGAVLALQTLNEERAEGKNADTELPPGIVDLGGEGAVRVSLERFCPTCGYARTEYRGSEMQGGGDPYVEHFFDCPGCKRSWTERG